MDFTVFDTCTSPVKAVKSDRNHDQVIDDQVANATKTGGILNLGLVNLQDLTIGPEAASTYDQLQSAFSECVLSTANEGVVEC